MTMLHNKIITLTFSPAIDKSASVAALIPEKKLSCSTPVYEPGGGGINVARAIKRLGGNATAIYFAGGYPGRFFTKLLSKENITTIPIQTISPTRENLVIKEEASQKQYRFGMPGTKVSATECSRFLKAVEQSADFQYLVVSGSLPPGVPATIFLKLAEISSTKKARLIVDTSGEALRYALEAGVFLIKPNLKELASLVNEETLSITQVEHASKTLISKYKCEVIITSLGADGAMMVTSDTMVRIFPPQVNVQSTVGAGDSMLAGVILGLYKQKNMVESAQYGVACGTAATLNPGTELCHLTDVERLYRMIRDTYAGQAGNLKFVEPELPDQL